MKKVIYEFNHIGFSTTQINAPFDILAQEEVRSRHSVQDIRPEGLARMTHQSSRMIASYDSAKRIFTVVSNDSRTLKKKIKIVRKISDMTDSYEICVSEKKQNVDIVLMKPDELKEISNSKELIKLLIEG